VKWHGTVASAPAPSLMKPMMSPSETEAGTPNGGLSKMDVLPHARGYFTLDGWRKSFHPLQNTKHRPFPEHGPEERRLARVPRRRRKPRMA
jgi:hypothetical protein